MDPVTAVVIAVVAALGVGFGAGWGLKPDAGAKAIEAQTEVIEALQTGNTQLVTEVQRVALEEAQRDVKIAEKLTTSRLSASERWAAIPCQLTALGHGASGQARVTGSAANPASSLMSLSQSTERACWTSDLEMLCKARPLVV